MRAKAFCGRRRRRDFLLTIFFLLVEDLIFTAILGALVGSSIIYQLSWANAGIGSKAELCIFRAIEAIGRYWAYIRLIDGTTSQIVFDAIGKHLKPILFLGGVAIDPILSLQVIFEHALTKIDQASRILRREWIGDFGAIGV